MRARLQEFQLLSYIMINLLHKLTNDVAFQDRCVRGAPGGSYRPGAAPSTEPAVRDSMTSSDHGPSRDRVLVGALSCAGTCAQPTLHDGRTIFEEEKKKGSNKNFLNTPTRQLRRTHRA